MTAGGGDADGELDRRGSGADDRHVLAGEVAEVVVDAGVGDEIGPDAVERGRELGEVGDAGGHDHVARLDLLAVGAGDSVAPRRPASTDVIMPGSSWGTNRRWKSRP